jgi:lipopolysaccharide transport system ATP-binding protein
MLEPIVRVENLSKCYTIGDGAARHDTLRDALTETARKLKNCLGLTRTQGAGRRGEEFWALKGVSFEVKRGEVVGIIGRNGAGKSTLLKILSRITEPTKGRAVIHGRVGCLLEVGTGFHPDLTGRENIYLNAAILGMRQAETRSKFDEIVAFSDVERFIDTPVKHYSSGMYVRLAFAVAAHLEPEVLIVDEVLAVGDSAFQKKCLSKMQEVGKQGRTVLFVSHNMSSVTRLCNRTILLEQGGIVRDGPSHEVVHTYLQGEAGTSASREWTDPTKRPGNETVRLCAVRVKSEDDVIVSAIDIRRPVGVEMEFEVLSSGQVLIPNLHFFNEEGTCVFITGDHDPTWKRRPRPRGRYVSTAWIPGNFLAEGTLIVRAAISTNVPFKVHLDERDVVAFQVVDSLDGDSARADYAGPFPGVVRPLLKWTTKYDQHEKQIPPEENVESRV